MTTSDPAASVGRPAVDVLGLGQVSLLVRDVDRAVAFYRDTLGLAHLFTFGKLAFFDIGGVRLYLQERAEAWQPGSILYFLVEDIWATYTQLEAAGVKTTDAPHVIYTDEQTGVQEWMAFFEDSEGNALAVLSRVPAGASS